MRPAEPLLLGVREAAQLAGIPRDAAFDLVRTGTWPTIKIAGRRKLYVPRAFLVGWAEQLAEAAVEVKPRKAADGG